MTSKELIIDTSKVRVKGEAKLNFANRTISVNLEPRAKKPQFFNLETPINIKGTFDQASAGVSPGGLLGSGDQLRHQPGVRPPAPPVRRHPAPSTGKDVCRSPQTWPPGRRHRRRQIAAPFSASGF